jgi:hypothetical protein
VSEESRSERQTEDAADHERPTGRRGFLAIIAGAFAALSARSLVSTPDADAANGDPVRAGRSVSATSLTKVTNTSDTGAGLWGVANGAARHGIYGTNAGKGHGAGGLANASGVAGVHGMNDDDAGYGVWGDSAGGFGVYGTSANGTGILGAAEGDAGVGVAGTASGFQAFGVQGVNHGNGIGVLAQSDGAGAALYAKAAYDVAVYADASVKEPTTIGVYASGSVGLQVEGPAVFSSSGVATVPAGSQSTTVDWARLTAGSSVLATAQASQQRYVVAAVPDVTNRRFTIHLNKAASADLPVAWFVIN